MQKYKKNSIHASGDAFFSYFCRMKHGASASCRHNNMEEVIQQTVEALRQGKTLLYPTDTIWGIGCDARNRDAVNRLYDIKERDHSKSMIVLVDNNPNTLTTLNIPLSPSDRPTTYILPRSVWHDEMHLAVADNIPAADGSLGVRIPQHALCQEVIRRLGAPLVSTSANLSGQPSPRCYAEIGEELKRRVDFCVPPLSELLSEETRGSRIVKLHPDGTSTIIRP